MARTRSKQTQKRTEKPVRRTHQQRGELELGTTAPPPISPGLINPSNEARSTLPPATRDRGDGPDDEPVTVGGNRKTTRVRSAGAKSSGGRAARKKTRGGTGPD